MWHSRPREAVELGDVEPLQGRYKMARVLDITRPRYHEGSDMHTVFVAIGLPALLALGFRVGHSFGFRDGFEAGRKERRGAGA